MIAGFLDNLGNAARELGDHEAARRSTTRASRRARELGDRWLVTYLLEDVALLLAGAGEAAHALGLAAAAARLRDRDRRAAAPGEPGEAEAALGAPGPCSGLTTPSVRLRAGAALLTPSGVSGRSWRDVPHFFHQEVGGPLADRRPRHCERLGRTVHLFREGGVGGMRFGRRRHWQASWLASLALGGLSAYRRSSGSGTAFGVFDYVSAGPGRSPGRHRPPAGSSRRLRRTAD